MGEDLVGNLVPCALPISGPVTEYDALSYTWGTNVRSSKIRILHDGQAYNLPITDNLREALEQLREPENLRIFWADAICIDQLSEKEKTSQFPRLAEVYIKATHVRVWLGKETPESARAIPFIHECVRNWDYFDDYVRTNVEDWMAFCYFLGRPWFKRRWIIQEISLARQATLHYGNLEVSWRDFCDVVALFRQKQSDIRDLFKESSIADNNENRFGDLENHGAIRLAEVSDRVLWRSDNNAIKGKLWSLEALMSSLTTFEASDPRDTIYAILWLTSDAVPSIRKRVDTDRLQKVLDEGRDEVASPVDMPIAFTATRAGRSHSVTDRRNQSVRPGAVRSTSSQDIRTGVKRPHDDDLLEFSDPFKRPTAGPISRPSQGNTKISPPPLPNIITYPEQINSKTNSGLSQESIAPSRSGTDPEKVLQINAALGFINGTNNKRFPIDYKRSCLEVYTDFLKFCIPKSKSLDILLFPWAPRVAYQTKDTQTPTFKTLDDELSTLPTWITTVDKRSFAPEEQGIHHRINADPLVGRPGHKKSPYSASFIQHTKLYSEPRFLEGIKLGRLIVRGFELATIKKKHRMATQGVIPSEWLNLVNWHSSKQEVPERFWRTIVANRDASGEQAPGHWKRMCQHAVKGRPANGNFSLKIVRKYTKLSSMIEFIDRVESVVFDKQMVSFDQERLEGTLGLAPKNVKKGDVVCILYGCSVPVLLRKYVDDSRLKCHKVDSADRTGETFYRVVGEMYVHGFMEGEAIKAKTQGKNLELR
jgi:hypothetical protein